MRWIWIDRFVAVESGKTATAVKNLSFAEDHFADHYPGFPVMPAPLILEGLAQTGGILVGEAKQFQEKVVLAKIPFAKFYRDAMPGEMLTYTTDIVDMRAEGAVVKGRVTCGKHSSRKRRFSSRTSTKTVVGKCSATTISSVVENLLTCSAKPNSLPRPPRPNCLLPRIDTEAPRQRLRTPYGVRIC